MFENTQVKNFKIKQEVRRGLAHAICIGRTCTIFYWSFIVIRHSLSGGSLYPTVIPWEHFSVVLEARFHFYGP